MKLPTDSIANTRSPGAQAALELANAGFRLLPLRPGAKAPPLISDWTRRASNNPLQVLVWWRRWPGANLGIATGCDGLVVFDGDPRHGAPPDPPGWLPATLTVRTPGNGWHAYLRARFELRSSDGAFGPGIEVKAAGRYVVAPPSRDTRGPWRWEEPRSRIAEIEAEVLRENEARCVRGRATSAPGRCDPTGWQPFDPAEPASVGDGQRHEYLRSYAGWLRSCGCEHDELEELLFAENERACGPPMDDADGWLLRLAAWAGRLPS
jgi:putative DNA primase/helicase